MRNLLIGNAPDSADAVVNAARRADIIIQVNRCRYAELLPRARANYVVVTNSGDPAEIWTPIMERLLALQGHPGI